MLPYLYSGSFSELLTGADGKAVGSAEKMKELWVPFFKETLVENMPVILCFLFFLITLTGSSNAINLTDGLDGLAIGCTVTVALTYAIMAYASGNFLISDYLKVSWIPGSGELTVVCSALLGEAYLFFGLMHIQQKFLWEIRARLQLVA